MNLNPMIARRTALAAALSGAAAVALAACSGSSSSKSSAPAANPAADGGSTSASGPESSATSAASSPAGSTGAAKSATAADAIATLADIKVGQAIAAKIDGQNVLVSRPTASTAACFSAICTHQGCTVKPDGTKLACPCHGSTFDAKTGDVLGGPAPSPLARIAVTVADGKVVKA